ncbi:MAG: hypothetical protein RMJ67_07580 [Elusimicrobiota bacterium]|nr:hypothetical protein [Endomicrobiia bacterium]MDW8166352.1 hypothetical protein [Elusimicrobiota bacterium]
MKKQNKDSLTQILDRLNSLSISLLDDIIEARRKKKVIDIEEIKAPLLVIKEIKDVAKINAKIADSTYGSELDLELDEVNALEEEIKGGLYEK